MMSLAGVGAVGYGTDGSTVVMGIDLGAALLWMLSYKSGLGWCVSSGLPSYAVATGAAAGAGRARVPSSLVSLRRLLEVLRPSTVAARAIRIWKSMHYFLLASYFAVLCPVFGLLLENRESDSVEDAVGRNAWLDCGDMLCLSVA